MTAAAVAYLTRTGNADLLPVLGLAPSPPPPRRVHRPVLPADGPDRSHHLCSCAPRGRRYRLCRVHGENRFRDEQFRTRED